MIAQIAEALVARSVARPWATVLLFVGLTLAAAVAIVTRLGIDTNTGAMMAPDLDWRQREIAFNRLFPHFEGQTVVVVDGVTGSAAEALADQLANRMLARRDLFSDVRRPFTGPFFDRNGLLFLDRPALSSLLERLIAAQPMLGTLAAEPSLGGLFAALDLVLDGVEAGQADLGAVSPILGALAQALDTGQRVDWAGLFAGGDGLQGKRRFVIARPIRDFSRLDAGGAASAFIREAARSLGANLPGGPVVRLTGDVPLADEEFATVAEGAGIGAGVAFVIVALLLWAALRSGRIILAVLVTLLAGLLATAAFAALAIGTLNLISVAFAVLFLGIGVDFGIQVATRFRAERHLHPDAPISTTAIAAGLAIGPALTLAAVTTALGFIAFVPTDFKGVAELGVIAGMGMAVAWAFNLTLLPALLVLFRPPGEPSSPGWRAGPSVDRWIARNRRLVLGVAAVTVLAGGFAATKVRFDADPLDLKDPTVESVVTLRDLGRDPNTSLDRLDALVAPDAAADTARRLAALPEVRQVLWLDAFVPGDQPAKLAMIADAVDLLGPTLEPEARPAASAADLRARARRLAERMARAAPGHPLATALSRWVALDDPALTASATRVAGDLPPWLDRLRAALGAGPVTRAELPASLTRDWIATDGRFRLEVTPVVELAGAAGRPLLVSAVERVAPWTQGPAVGILRSAEVVMRSFAQSGVIAAIGIALVLGLVLRRAADVALTLAPLVAAGAWTAGTMVVVGLPLNFANVIALPLLLGIGVAFGIYLVIDWRHGQQAPIGSPVARAVLFSAGTTAVSFGSLAISAHPGTASMGLLLLIALGYALVATLVLLPALLASASSASARAVR